MTTDSKTITVKYGYALEDYKLDARDCPGCAGCRWVDFIYMPGLDFSWRCPPWLKYRFDDYGACGRLRIIHDLLAGGLDYGSPTVARVAYSCMLCGACDAGCKRNLDLEPEGALEAFRVRLVELGKGPLPAHLPIADNIIQHRNRFGVKRPVSRRDWMPGDIKPSAITEALYFAGCRATKGKATVAAAAARLMAISGLPFRTMDDECCCGLYLVTIGKIKEAREIARANIEGIKATGAKKVVFSCAECYKAFKVDYPKLLGISTSDLPFQPVHLSEELDTALRCGRLKFTRPIEMTVTYHDACALGRMSEPWIQWEGERREWGVMEPKRQIRRGTNGIYEPPRNLLRAIPSLKLVEMPRHHENAWCCGNAGGVREAFPDLAVWTASERLREAQHVKTEAVVAACPGCCDNLGDAAQNGNGSMEVFEFHDFLLRAL